MSSTSGRRSRNGAPHTAAAGVAGSVRRMDRAKAHGVVNEFYQEIVLLRVAVVDEQPRVDPSPGLEPVPRVTASDPPPPRDHLPSVRVAPEELDDEVQKPLHDAEISCSSIFNRCSRERRNGQDTFHRPIRLVAVPKA